MSDIFERARGHWFYILTSFGISADFLKNRHGPCPMCGGKDRFRFDNKHNEGTYICGQCGAGNGIILLRKFKGWNHVDACHEIEKIIGAAPARAAIMQEKRALSPSVERLIEEATDPSVVDAYLARRGLAVAAPMLGGHPSCPYFVEDNKGRYRVTGRHPAVVASIVDGEGKRIGVQRVYDADVPERKKVLGELKGGVVRLGDPVDELGVCEGFETGLAVFQLFGVPVWATLTANNLEIFDPPAGIMRLSIYGDNDESGVGQAAAYKLAVRVNRTNKQDKTGADSVRVLLPPEIGTDWLDVLVRGGIA